MSLTKLFPGQGEFGLWPILAGDGKIANLFSKCRIQHTVFTVFTHPVTSSATTAFLFTCNNEIIIQLLFLHERCTCILFWRISDQTFILPTIMPLLVLLTFKTYYIQQSTLHFSLSLGVLHFALCTLHSDTALFNLHPPTPDSAFQFYTLDPRPFYAAPSAFFTLHS